MSVHAASVTQAKRGSTNMEKTVDYKARLTDLCFELDMPTPDFTSMANNDKRQARKTFLAKVKIGNRTWTSHPATFHTVELAEAEAAQKALKELEEKKELLILGNAANPQEHDKILLIQNVIKIINEQPGGAKLMMHNAVAEEYAVRFNSKVPKNWIELIEGAADRIIVERQQFNREVVLIGLPKSPSSIQPTKPTLAKPNGTATKSTSQPAEVEDYQDEPVAMRPPAPSKLANNNSLLNKAGGDRCGDVLKDGAPLPPAVLPKIAPNPKLDSDYFDVCVVMSANPSHFYVQDYNSSSTAASPYMRLQAEMLEFYNNEENQMDLPAALIENGMYVAGKYSDAWYRVQIESVIAKDTSNMQLMCLLVDCGEMHMLELKDIQPLFNQFRSLPTQAIRASLANVEPLSGDWDVLAAFEFGKMVENKAFVATVHDIKNITVNGRQTPLLKLSLCDTSLSVDVVIDQVLVQKNFAKFVKN